MSSDTSSGPKKIVPLARRSFFLIHIFFFLAVSFLHFNSLFFPALILKIWEIFIAASFLLVLFFVGNRILQLEFFEEALDNSLLLRLIMSIGIGAIPFSLGILGIGTLGFLNRNSLIGFTVFLAVLSFILSKEKFQNLQASPLTLSESFSKFDLGLSYVCFSIFIIGFLSALAPPTAYDSLVYHLALPAKYLQAGKIEFISFNHYSCFPQNMEMLYAWFLSLGDDVPTQIFNWFLCFLTGVSLYQIGKEFDSSRLRRWDIFLYAISPSLILLGSETYVEAPMAFWTTLALLSTAIAIKKRNKYGFLLSGVFCGFNCGIKYTGILTPLILATLLFFQRKDFSISERVRNVCLVLLPAFIVFSPWLVKNFIYTGGNPVYPFFHNIFPATNVFMQKETALSYFKILDEYKPSHSFLIEILLMPFRMATNIISFGGGADVSGIFGWVIPLVLVPLGFPSKDKRTEEKVLYAYCVVHILAWASMRPVLRFLFPIFPLVCFFAGRGIERILSAKMSLLTWSVNGILGVSLILNLISFYFIQKTRGPFTVALGLTSRNEYLREKIDSYAACEYIEKNLPLDKQIKILIIGDQKGYYCPRPYLATMAGLPQPMAVWSDQARSGEDLRAILRNLGFSHVLFNRKEAGRLKNYGIMDFSENGQKNWEALLSAVQKIYDTNGICIYSLS